ncbi:unnamed protein product [Rotaria sordida]|uniref:Uncharacterized protein n=1 Tax=Rotaria sordida TaxID=392033 RepID=A0A820I936_9BILA|nr:unnamed protein product [Rotaria sordida]CAF1509274.1 unnamed protein product [Rotaria sordida]CAF4303585.1 unnamed protein product [Rotaria sordida]
MNRDSSNKDSDKAVLTGSTSGQSSSDFRSTDAKSAYPGQVLPEANDSSATSGNSGTQGQTGTSTNKTTPGQAGEGIPDRYKK